MTCFWAPSWARSCRLRHMNARLSILVAQVARVAVSPVVLHIRERAPAYAHAHAHVTDTGGRATGLRLTPQWPPRATLGQVDDTVCPVRRPGIPHRPWTTGRRDSRRCWR